MAIVVEDGTGKANAESYVSVSEADAYFAARNILTWDEVEEKEAALRLATDYMVSNFRGRWQGWRAIAAQALDWPRVGVSTDNITVVSDDIVPLEVKRACAELALKASSDSLQPDYERSEKRVKIGPLEVEYDAHSSSGAAYTAVEAMLKPYLEGGGAGFGVKVVRT